MFERRGEKLSRMLKMNVLLMKNVLWRTDELDPTAIYCYGTFLMSLKNLVSGFCQTYSIGNTLAENNRCFRKKRLRMLHRSIFLGVAQNKDILGEDIRKSVFCFSHFVLGGVFV